MDISELQNHVGEEIKYQELCSLLNIEKKGGNAKKKQLKDLSDYCLVETLSHPTRYKIIQIYENNLVNLRTKSQFQPYVEQVILQELKANNYKPLFLSNIELMRKLCLINDNFKYICTPALFSGIPEGKEWMTEESWNIYAVLQDWVGDRLRMASTVRDLFHVRKGYRLSKLNSYMKGEEVCYYTQKWDVPEIDDKVNRALSSNEKIGQKCWAIMAQAKHDILPVNWESNWLPNNLYRALYSRVDELVRAEFDREWTKMRPVHMIDAVPNKEIIDLRLKDVEDIINAESCRKIETTKRLKGLIDKPEKRKELVDDVIDIHTKTVFKKEEE